MFTRLARLLVVATALAAPAWAALLETGGLQTVRYRIHEDPTDPTSPVKLQIELLLERQQTELLSVGWTVRRIEFRKPVDGGWQIWGATDPEVATASGLWWVTHVNPLEPVRSEFLEPPPMTGVATAVGADGELHYEIEGHLYVPPPGGAPWPVTAALSYSLLDAAAAPVVEPKTLEPVEVPPCEPD